MKRSDLFSTFQIRSLELIFPMQQNKPNYRYVYSSQAETSYICAYNNLCNPHHSLKYVDVISHYNSKSLHNMSQRYHSLKQILYAHTQRSYHTSCINIILLFSMLVYNNSKWMVSYPSQLNTRRTPHFTSK